MIVATTTPWQTQESYHVLYLFKLQGLGKPKEHDAFRAPSTTRKNAEPIRNKRSCALPSREAGMVRSSGFLVLHSNWASSTKTVDNKNMQIFSLLSVPIPPAQLGMIVWHRTSPARKQAEFRRTAERSTQH